MAGVSRSSAPNRSSKPAPLEAHVVGHGQDEPVALDGSRHGQPDAGVAARRLHDGGARRQQPSPLGILEHGESDPVLDAPTRVDRLELGHDGGTARARASG